MASNTSSILKPASHRRVGVFSSAKQSPGWVHFIGIGGAGLSALASLALKQGWRVSGSDAAWSTRLKLLETSGASVFLGHNPTHFEESSSSFPDAVVVSSAIPPGNSEVEAAREHGMRILKRGEWLGEITRDYELVAVAGTHGKSTTTAMLAQALNNTGEDVTAIVGADVPQFPGGSNFLSGSGKLFVLEADEYDGCFLGVSPSLAVVTSVEWEHVDLYPDEESVRNMFKQFVSRIKPGGSLIVYGDSAGPRSLLTKEVNSTKIKSFTYGLDEANDWRATSLEPNLHGGTNYVVVHHQKPIASVSLKLPGVYNVLNSLAVIAAASVLAARGESFVDESSRLKAMETGAKEASLSLQNFKGIHRRFEYKGSVLGCQIYDDYAHHPTEVRAVLQAARQRFGQKTIWVVFQPHTFSRLAMLLHDFAQAFSEADKVFITEVFSAREENIWKISGSDLVSLIRDPPAVFISTLEEVAEILSREIRAMAGKTNGVNDSSGGLILLTLGAGDVTRIGPNLLTFFERSESSIF